MHLGQAGVGNFFVGERLGNDAYHAATLGEASVSDRAHEAHVAAPIYERDAAASEQFAEILRGSAVGWSLSMIRAAEHTEGMDHGLIVMGRGRVPALGSRL